MTGKSFLAIGIQLPGSELFTVYTDVWRTVFIPIALTMYKSTHLQTLNNKSQPALIYIVMKGEKDACLW